MYDLYLVPMTAVRELHDLASCLPCPCVVFCIIWTK